MTPEAQLREVLLLSFEKRLKLDENTNFLYICWDIFLENSWSGDELVEQLFPALAFDVSQVGLSWLKTFPRDFQVKRFTWLVRRLEELNRYCSRFTPEELTLTTKEWSQRKSQR
ncbi:hypothetical protein MHLP_03605 [Candidatus Mycoplasma haematolamae str. Purdue]|uniref:Uncharacterized protein n=1 Tax=Mycoplasma haematolamae (strain Purdue) TaxID=1212765 RepID=I7CGB4_MYCHA|nr:hypothetical protein [Candidatus Mycoplasma haematolamae]AFO52301.1 hypothetical protein MHLP_03605 [Candidatus Mycoplasma haematolamae str. Purdue]